MDTVSITVNPVNDAPVNTVPGAQAVNENTLLNSSGISVNDADGNLYTLALAVTHGTLNVTLSGAASISSGANGSNTLSLSGSQADINATLATLLYQGSLNYNGADTLTVTSTDSNSASDVDTVAITVTAQNDAPVNTVPGAQTVNEDTSLVIGGISVVDVDDNLSTMKKMEESLSLKVGETTRDLAFSLEVVRCVGACGLAPVMFVDNDVHAMLQPEKIDAILDRY